MIKASVLTTETGFVTEQNEQTPRALKEEVEGGESEEVE